MLLPCRFCTRMSLICPMNSSRSNQSSHSCPAIWAVDRCWDPGSGSLTKLPRFGRGKAIAGATAVGKLIVYCRAGRLGARKPGAPAEKKVALTDRTSPLVWCRIATLFALGSGRKAERNGWHGRLQRAAAPGWYFRGGMDLILHTPPAPLSLPAPLSHAKISYERRWCNEWNWVINLYSSMLRFLNQKEKL